MVKFPDTPLTETAWIRVVLFTGILSLQYLFAIVSWVNQCLTLFWVPFFRIKQGLRVENKIWLYNRKNINLLLHYYKCNIKYSCNITSVCSLIQNVASESDDTLHFSILLCSHFFDFFFFLELRHSQQWSLSLWVLALLAL